MRIGGMLLAAAAVVGGWQAALAQLSAEEVARRVAARFGVEVLKVREVEDERGRLFAVTVLLPEEAGNAAFQVGILYVDAETAEPVPRLVHRPAGYELPRPLPGAPEPVRERMMAPRYGPQAGR